MVKERPAVIYGIFALIIILSYAIPYTILAQVPRMYGAYLFWLAMAAVTILLVSVLTIKWRD